MNDIIITLLILAGCLTLVRLAEPVFNVAYEIGLRLRGEKR